uniref:hypothetical protein n=1 Tax=Flavobacterium sp. TaxID=239 RepID=UPI004049F422
MEIEILGDHQEYIEESFNEVLKRYTRFGKELYRIIEKELPSVFNKLKFYRATKSTEKYVYGAQLEDSYAIYDDGKIMFSIQLEPESEIICLNNLETQIEIGDWEQNDYYKQTIDFIKIDFLKIDK